MASLTSTATLTPGPDHAPGQFDDLMTPSGSTIGLTRTEDLRTQLAKLGVPGSHTDGRNTIVARYAEMLKRVHDDAGSKAVNEWLAQRKADV